MGRVWGKGAYREQVDAVEFLPWDHGDELHLA